MKIKKLDVIGLKLYGRHLIEASAGTGKTYNITRLYLRLLIEKQLAVQQILVMTFSKSATQELRGRIDSELRNALANWDDLSKNDDFYQHLAQTYSKEQVTLCLKPALLELDEAAIFTLHGFCSRSLKTQAFASALPLEITMEADSKELLMQAVCDWMRAINHNQQAFSLLSQKNWHTPDKFYNSFYPALISSTELLALDESEIKRQHVLSKDVLIKQFNRQKQQLKSKLQMNEANFNCRIIQADKDPEKRLRQWQELIAWLDNTDDSMCSKDVDLFIRSRAQYKENKAESDLIDSFKVLRKAFLDSFKKLEQQFVEQIEHIPLHLLVVQAILQIRKEFNKTKQQAALMDYDDLITYLSQRLLSDQGEPLILALRAQYPYALVDEFQDTDPQQYAILDKLYPKASKENALFMIGDPKQAIYSFRGGDIFTYLNARDGADFCWNMDTNWRSLSDVVSAYNRLFWGNALDQPAQALFGYGIDYHQIKSTPLAQAAKSPLVDEDNRFAAVNYCYLESIEGADAPTAAIWRSALATWCVVEISRLLSTVTIANSRIAEKDIAILVRSRSEAALIREALVKAHFASVYLSAKDSIYETKEAQELLLVLRGIVDSENSRLLIAALSTCLMGGDSDKLLLLQDPDHSDEWEKQRTEVIDLRQQWVKQGILPMLIALIKNRYLPQADEHERALSNMLQLAELLQTASTKYPQPRQLIKWFDEQIQQVNSNESSQLRLESDADLIRVVTIHGSKGLEYPIVFIPFASNYSDPTKVANKSMDFFNYHDPDSRAIKQQIGKSDVALQQVTYEAHAESIRLLYVAITRASHRCYFGIAPIGEKQHDKSHLSALALALQLNNKAQWKTKLAEVVNSSDKSSALILINPDEKQMTNRQFKSTNKALNASIFKQQSIKEYWQMQSFSSLTKRSYAFSFNDFIPDRKDQHDAIDMTRIKPSEETLALRFSLKKGVDAGNLLHDIMQLLDFSHVDFQLIKKPLTHFTAQDINPRELENWILDYLDAPIPIIANQQESFSLSLLSRQQTLREAEFYFPMHKVLLNELQNCLFQHRGKAFFKEGFQNQSKILPEKEQLEGMMRGFIDLIFEYKGKYYLADYKSTHLANELDSYHFDALKNNNEQHHYDLQYLIYALALHRYLKSRLLDYQPERHFGGVYYFYLRGMSAKAIDYSGIYYTALEASFLQHLDDIFSGHLLPPQVVEMG